MNLTEVQFAILLSLYHEFHEAFCTLSNEVQDAFYLYLKRRGE